MTGMADKRASSISASTPISSGVASARAQAPITVSGTVRDASAGVLTGARGRAPLDVRAAHAAGMASIGVLSGVSRHEDLVEAAPHAIVASITDVVGVIR